MLLSKVLVRIIPCGIALLNDEQTPPQLHADVHGLPLLKPPEFPLHFTICLVVLLVMDDPNSLSF